MRDGKDIDYVGASGEINFDQYGDVVSTMRVWIVRDGKIVDTDLYLSPGDEIDPSLLP